MRSLPGLSRRALVAAGLVAAAPAAAAKKKKTKKSSPPLPALAFVAAIAMSVEEGDDATTFRWTVQSQTNHPESGLTLSNSGAVIMPVETSDTATRARLVAAVREDAASFLQGFNQDVPANRIAVVLL